MPSQAERVNKGHIHDTHIADFLRDGSCTDRMASLGTNHDYDNFGRHRYRCQEDGDNLNCTQRHGGGRILCLAAAR